MLLILSILVSIKKELCVANIEFHKKERRKVTFRSGGNKNEIDFVTVAQKHTRYLKNMKVISGELQHKLVVTDVVRTKIMKEIKRKQIIRKKDVEAEIIRNKNKI